MKIIKKNNIVQMFVVLLGLFIGSLAGLDSALAQPAAPADGSASAGGDEEKITIRKSGDKNAAVKYGEAAKGGSPKLKPQAVDELAKKGPEKANIEQSDMGATKKGGGSVSVAKKAAAAAKLAKEKGKPGKGKPSPLKEKSPADVAKAKEKFGEDLKDQFGNDLNVDSDGNLVVNDAKGNPVLKDDGSPVLASDDGKPIVTNDNGQDLPPEEVESLLQQEMDSLPDTFGEEVLEGVPEGADVEEGGDLGDDAGGDGGGDGGGGGE